MIIVLKPSATENDAQLILRTIKACGLKALYMPGVEQIVLAALGEDKNLATLKLASHPAVDTIEPILTSYKQVSRQMQSHDSQIKVGQGKGQISVGGGTFTVIAGPCAIETKQQISLCSSIVKGNGASMLRGGAFKPRSSPYSFQGLQQQGLEMMQQASQENTIPCVSEIIDASQLALFSEYVDALQIGARNMQNFQLLKAVGQSQMPVILKRGMSATIEEFLLAAEYIYDQGNQNIILCERGIRTFEKATRNTLDLSAVALIKQRSHLPVIVDPSHATGVRELVSPMSRAAAACGADGIMVEVHNDPENARSDGKQSLNPAEFESLMRSLRPFVEASGKVLKS
jgi:3-deoxy-7-phosphoheptulonate synthase